MGTEEDLAEWLDLNTFYCEKLRCRMTEKQCKINRSLYAEDEGIPLSVWIKAHSGLKKLLANQRRPLGCDKCPKNQKSKDG